MGQLLQSGAGAGAAVLLAHRFGRNATTDGFLTAYGVYLVLGLAAQSFRLVVVPKLTRAAADGRLAGETRAWAFAFLTLSVPVCLVAIVARHPIGDALTNNPVSAHEASSAIAFLVPAAFVQLLAALLASSLAALDEYTVAALAWGLGSPLGPGRLRRAVRVARADHARLGRAVRRLRDDGDPAGRARAALGAARRAQGAGQGRRAALRAGAGRGRSAGRAGRCT